MLSFDEVWPRVGRVVFAVVAGCALFSAACAADPTGPSGAVQMAQVSPAPPAAATSPSVTGVALPPGAGREVVERICSGCHSLAYIGARRDTPEGWTAKVDEMIGYGARPNSDETDLIIKYLSENLRK